MTVPNVLESSEGNTTAGPSNGLKNSAPNQNNFGPNATEMRGDASQSNTSSEKSLDVAIKACIAYCKEKDISEPVEILSRVYKFQCCCSCCRPKAFEHLHFIFEQIISLN